MTEGRRGRPVKSDFQAFMNNIIVPGYKFKNAPYKIIKKIGQGGQCNVYLARKGRENFAVKELYATHEDPSIQAGYINMFRREYELLSILAHPVLPRAYSYFQENDRHFVAVEFISGENLSQIMNRIKKPFPKEVVLEIAFKISELLMYLSLREKPVLLRDIKPLNIIITRSGKVKFIDFSIAREYSSDRGDTLRLGSPGYAPPEQYTGKSEAKSDVFALGVTMHELLSLEDPSLNPLKLSFKFNPPVSRAMCDLIRMATALKPEERYSPEEFHNRLKENYYRRISPDPLYKNISPLKAFSLEIYCEEKKYPLSVKKDSVPDRMKDKKSSWKKKKKKPGVMDTEDDVFMHKKIHSLSSRSFVLLILWALYFLFGVRLLNNPVVFMITVLLGLIVILIIATGDSQNFDRLYTLSKSELIYEGRFEKIEILLDKIEMFTFSMADNNYIIEGDGKRITFNKDISGWDKLKHLIELRTGRSCICMEDNDVLSSEK
jgi:serine/threonine protein kinase